MTYLKLRTSLLHQTLKGKNCGLFDGKTLEKLLTDCNKILAKLISMIVNSPDYE